MKALTSFFCSFKIVTFIVFLIGFVILTNCKSSERSLTPMGELFSKKDKKKKEKFDMKRKKMIKKAKKKGDKVKIIYR